MNILHWFAMELGLVFACFAAVHAPLELIDIFRVSEAVTRRPIVEGNRIQILHNGEQAYPSMFEVIENAKSTLLLSTYIFDTNSTGMRFIDALTRSTPRGLDVRFTSHFILS